MGAGPSRSDYYVPRLQGGDGNDLGEFDLNTFQRSLFNAMSLFINGGNSLRYFPEGATSGSLAVDEVGSPEGALALVIVAWASSRPGGYDPSDASGAKLVPAWDDNIGARRVRLGGKYGLELTGRWHPRLRGLTVQKDGDRFEVDVSRL
jgi:hypothetical protein